MSIMRTPFGADHSGRPMTLYTMTNQAGASVSVSDYGAHLVAVKVPDRKGELADVCLGYDSLREYGHNGGYLGATVGRYANRIGGSSFPLNGKVYPLTPTEGKNTLHGGKIGFDKKAWNCSTHEEEGKDRLVMTYVSPDGEEGYPGKMNVKVTFTFDDACALTIHYEAVSDQDTIVNLTNHAYFNLAGKGVILGHSLKIPADYVTDVDAELIPTGELLPVEGTILDLRKGEKMGDCIARKAEHRLMEGANGFDVNYVLKGEGLREAALLRDEESGREMQVLTTEPGIQVYSGQGLNQPGHHGIMYHAYGGVALETQHFPDSPHHPQFPSVVLKAGDTFDSTTVLAFSAR